MNSGKILKLTNAERQRVNSDFDHLQKSTTNYGYPDENRIGDPCFRVKKVKDHTISRRSFKSYGIGYMKHHGDYPELNSDLSTINRRVIYQQNVFCVKR